MMQIYSRCQLLRQRPGREVCWADWDGQIWSFIPKTNVIEVEHLDCALVTINLNFYPLFTGFFRGWIQPFNHQSWNWQHPLYFGWTMDDGFFVCPRKAGRKAELGHGFACQ